jgi:methyl coenzyme M reductase subunit D
MSNCQKVQKVIYEVGIGSFLRLHSIWSQKLKFHETPDSVQDRILAAQSTSKSHNFLTAYRIEVCK